LGDSKEIISNRLQGVADHVLMPLPEKAFEYLPYAVSALKATGGWIHYYDFEHATKTETPAEKTMLRLSKKLASLGVPFQIPFSRVVRPTGPNWYQVAIDIRVTRISDKS
jgi:tRNA (guanine37-N1)-methyltransferase